MSTTTPSLVPSLPIYDEHRDKRCMHCAHWVRKYEVWGTCSQAVAVTLMAGTGTNERFGCLWWSPREGT